MFDGLGNALVGLLRGLAGAIVVLGVFLAVAIVIANGWRSDRNEARADVCTFAFAQADSLRDSLEVTITYDYCELPGDDNGE